MTKKISLVLAALLMVFAGACGPSLNAGAIVEKQYDDPDDYPATTSICTGYSTVNGISTCTSHTNITTWHTDPERFLLVLQENVDGKMVTDSVSVSESMWEKCRVGWRYPECEPR